VRRITYILVFSGFLLNSDRCDCILIQAVTLKINLYISLYRLSCDFTFLTQIEYLYKFHKKASAEAALSVVHA
jgi:hypothetical protein